MRELIFAIFITGLSIIPACHPLEVPQMEPDPNDTTEVPIDTLTCEDTVAVNLPGMMENGYIKAIKICRAWIASGYAKKPGIPTPHLFVSGLTFYPFVGVFGDTTLLKAEGVSFAVPKKVGKFPLIDPTGVFYQDSVTCGYSYLDDDVALALWNVDPSFSDNELEVTEYDPVGKRIKGRFNVHFIIDTTSENYQGYRQKKHFHSGEFDVKMID